MRSSLLHPLLLLCAVVVVDVASKAAARSGALDRMGSVIHLSNNPDYMLGIADRSNALLNTVLAGGITANLIDRAGDGSVLDFVRVGPIVMNFADVAISVALIWSTAVALRRPPELSFSRHRVGTHE